MCDALSAKADILIKLGDLQGTKAVLRKAYKLQSQSNSPPQRKLIENNLKIGV